MKYAYVKARWWRSIKVSFAFEMNDTSSKVASLEVEENDLVIKILASTIWIILEFPCNAMLFGLVQFERIGGDPLKRRITDKV